MQLDRAQIQAVIDEPHAYYGSREIRIQKDTRWYPGVTNLVSIQLAKMTDRPPATSRVLDVGCGDGEILLELSGSFQTGVGIDYDAEHIRLAEEARRAQGVENVEFLRLDFRRELDRLPSGSFDLVFSMRGPIDTPADVQAAHRLLCPGGLLLCEEIGELHHKEKMETFEPEVSGSKKTRVVDALREMLEQNGFDVRLAADLFTKWIYPDVYEWLRFECNIRSWLGEALPEADDERIALFAERNINAAGEIVTTHHVVWAAGVRR